MVNRPMEIDGVKYFKCKKCGEVKPLNSAYFHRNTTAMMGYISKCIECVREEMSTIYKPKKRYITKAELEEENKKMKDVINEVIKIAYDKDADEAITYLVNLNLFNEKNNND